MVNSIDSNLGNALLSLSQFSLFLVSNNMSKHLDSSAMLSLLACCIIVVSEAIGCKHVFVLPFYSNDCSYGMSQIMGIQG